MRKMRKPSLLTLLALLAAQGLANTASASAFVRHDHNVNYYPYPAGGQNQYTVDAYDDWSINSSTTGPIDTSTLIVLRLAIEELRQGDGTPETFNRFGEVYGRVLTFGTVGECFRSHSIVNAAPADNGSMRDEAYYPEFGESKCIPRPAPFGGTATCVPSSWGGDGYQYWSDVQDVGYCTTNPDDPCCYCPILVDLGGHGFDLSGPGDPVSFDLNADGILERVSWTLAGAQDAFLVLDRNGNGVIDDGRELFGNHTPMPNGRSAPNGYVALAAYDSPSLGGNGDGVIDARDAVFSSLQLWVDRNHNGVSEASELYGLEEAGVVRIGLAYREERRRDRYGNAFRFWGSAWVSRGTGRDRRVDTCDVFFVRAR